MEEIVRTWNNWIELVQELVQSETDINLDVRKVSTFVKSKPALSETWHFRFLDADGNELRFPLTLLSDTKIK